MNQVLLQNLTQQYIEYITQHSRITDDELRSNFLKLLLLENPLDRLKAWKNFKVSVPSFKQLIHLANPFYIGYGNPQADILFLGKEKAFNMSHEPELFIHESVNNSIQWEHILSKKGAPDHERLFKELGFNPMFPKQYFSWNFKKRHTWGLYSEIVRQLNGLSGEILNASEYERSFFSHCFLSEINYIPSRYSEGRKLDCIRKEFLKQDFYRSFPIVIIGALGYLNSADITEIFGTLKEQDLLLGENRSRSIRAKLYTSPTQKIILCNQLSGAAGWTTAAIKTLVDEITERPLVTD